ncbi:flagellar hook-associated protein FlgK [Sulfurospirillum diekertiae]|uniref:Flagellar hook-associated protein 1 n=1 Tax=Sulfurospirillum diekertiae TaxID=1854492 RepID=A0A1Y0HKL1_9BACT|nr:flagellar hook-associated protein FlgK [Sulfurospirillum diekertiae]ARU48602.1 Flagellar hook-associated protein 1 [Sulfurospirillum diekertiae]ASC93432.1 Flagellar hook-associated protein 1 [Sulfurospirillum diekertiae]
MSNLFGILNTGNSGLNAAQVAVATTSQNIANAQNTFYTRQRVSFSASPALSSQGVSVGSGVTVTSIVRIHDELVFSKLRSAATSLSYDTNSSQSLQEVAKYFPDLSDAGIAKDLTSYFTEWNNLASNTTAGSQKIALVQAASTLGGDIQSTRETIRNLQDSVNTQLKSTVDEVNSIGQQMADVNKQIATIESQKGNYANDLRDKRDQLELTLSNLIGFSVSKGNLISNDSVDANMTDTGTQYYLNIAGATLVDGSTFHPLVIDNSSNGSSYYSIYSEIQDGTRYNLTEQLSGGKIGSMLDLRGRVIDPSVNGGYPQDGTIQSYINNLDTFAQSVITETNNIYANSAQKSMQTPNLDLKSNTSLQNAYNNVENGSFDMIVYDSAGKEVAHKTITIDNATTMGDDTFSKSILTQINTSTDDNKDNNSLNDVDDYFKATFADNGAFSLSPTINNNGYTIAIKDKGTNFPGTVGISQFFTGTDASNIDVKAEYKKDSSLIQGYGAPISGNQDVANAMLQLQYNKINFYGKSGSVSSDTISGYYSAVTTKVATDASASKSSYDTNEALYNTINTQFQSISGVNKDEELANLIQYQKSYTAAAKIITTINEMLDTLLGIKQ